MRNGQSVGIISRFRVQDNPLKPDESREKTRCESAINPAQRGKPGVHHPMMAIPGLYKSKAANPARSWPRPVPWDMPNIKRLRLMFYVLATIELVLISSYFGWGRMLLR